MKSKELLKNKSPFLFITGPAGSGKTFLVREALNLNPKWGILTATTGVAARVLGTNVLNSTVQTVHSTLGFGDMESFFKSHEKGSLRKVLKHLRKKHKRLIIDESSMLRSEMFEVLCAECEGVGMGLVITGDFLQLPAIYDVKKEGPKPSGWKQWLFETPSWEKFKENTIRLDTQYRHEQGSAFLTALNLLRAGNGIDALPFLKQAGVKFVQGGQTGYALDPTFNGMTLVGRRETRNLTNGLFYEKLPSQEYVCQTKRWGDWQKKDWYEWPQEDFPAEVKMKAGTRVMITRNLYGLVPIDPTKKVDTDTLDIQPLMFKADGSPGAWTLSKKQTDETDELTDEQLENANLRVGLIQANGDTGVIEEVGEMDGALTFAIERDNDPAHTHVHVQACTEDNSISHYDIEAGQRVKIIDQKATAWISYMPLQQAWASTVHKAQGLTINHPTRVIIKDMWGNAMVYVACSRVKNPADLTLVGAEEMIADGSTTRLDYYCKTDPAVKEWIDGKTDGVQDTQANAAKGGA
jgi:hypothetical protein